MFIYLAKNLRKVFLISIMQAVPLKHIIVPFHFPYAEGLNETNELVVCVISLNGNIIGLSQAM